MVETDHSDAGDAEAVATADVPHLLDMLFEHRVVLIQDFLRGKRKPFSGTREKLRARVKGYLDDQVVQSHELIDLLNRVEGWGNQHIYLYKSPAEQIEKWNSEAKARGMLKARGKDELLNRRLPVLLPANPTLSAVTWTPRAVRFVWVERREWREHVAEMDYVQDDIEFTAHRVRRERGLVTFDWDLVSGHAALLIQRLPSGENYRDARGRFAAELEPLVRLSKFEPVFISPAILTLEKSGEVRHRHLEHATERGAKISFVSRTRAAGAFDDPALKKAREALGDKLAGQHGNFYLPMPDATDREIHIKLYAKDQRLGIFGECTEQEVRHVLSRVRHHCS